MELRSTNLYFRGWFVRSISFARCPTGSTYRILFRPIQPFNLSCLTYWNWRRKQGGSRSRGWNRAQQYDNSSSC